MHRDHKWPGRFLGARDSCGEHCAYAMESSTPSKNNTGEGRLERCHAIREGFFTSPLKTLEQSVEPLSISSASSFVVTRSLAKARRIAGCSHIVQRDDAGKFPGARNFKTVIEHRGANVVAPKRVISVRYGINETFKPSELGVFGNCLKCAIGS